MRSQLLLTGLLFLSSLFLSAQSTISLRLDPSSEDAAVDNWYPNGNYPNETDYCSGTWTINGTQVSWRSFFKFDLSMIPPGSVVNSAYLSLYYAHPNSFNDVHQSLTSSNESVLQRVTDPWQENLIAWNNQPAVTNVDEVFLPQSTSGTQDYPNMDVTPMVQEMVNTGNYGFSLRQVVEIQYGRMIFASGDHPDSSQRPLLIVTFTPQVTCLHLKIDKAGEDATVDDFNPANNNPNEIEYFCGGWTINSIPVRWRNFFKFDLSQIPQGAVVQSAALSLYFAPNNNFFATDTSMTSSNESVIRRVITPWTENTINWNTQPNTSNQNQVILAPTTSSTQDFPNIDVSGMVQDMVNSPGISDGFMLKMANEIPYARMIVSSGDNPDTTLHPTLDVCYYMLPTAVPTLQPTAFEVYPNPTTSDIYIRWNPSASYRGLEILNPLGELIADYDVTGMNSFSVNTANWAKGIYFVRLGNQPVQRICVQ